MEDEELDRLLRKRFLEMQRRAQSSQKEEKKEPTPDETLRSVLVGRAWEVLGAARRQYPKQTAEVERALVQAVTSGRFTGKVSGVELYNLFRSLGLRVKLKTSIKVYKGGELKSLAEKLKEASE